MAADHWSLGTLHMKHKLIYLHDHQAEVFAARLADNVKSNPHHVVEKVATTQMPSGKTFFFARLRYSVAKHFRNRVRTFIRDLRRIAA